VSVTRRAYAVVTHVSAVSCICARIFLIPRGNLVSGHWEKLIYHAQMWRRALRDTVIRWSTYMQLKFCGNSCHLETLVLSDRAWWNITCPSLLHNCDQLMTIIARDDRLERSVTSFTNDNVTTWDSRAEFVWLPFGQTIGRMPSSDLDLTIIHLTIAIDLMRLRIPVSL